MWLLFQSYPEWRQQQRLISFACLLLRSWEKVEAQLTGPLCVVVDRLARRDHSCSVFDWFTGVQIARIGRKHLALNHHAQAMPFLELVSRIPERDGRQIDLVGNE